MSAAHTLVTLWMGGPIGSVECACLMSALRHGHDVVLFCYEDLPNCPPGIRVEDARDVVPEQDVFTFDGIANHWQTGSYGPFSDLFRWKLMAEGRGVWIDTDIYFLGPLRFEDWPLLCWEVPHRDDNKLPPVCNGVIGLASDDTIVAEMAALFEKPYEMPPWVSKERRRACLEKLAGRPFFPGALAYGSYGPAALSEIVRKLGREADISPHTRYCPVPFVDVRRLGEVDKSFREALPADAEVVHVYASLMRDVFPDGPPDGSFMASILSEVDAP